VSAIDLVEDDDRAALRKLARDVAERDIAPHAPGWDETEEFAEASSRRLRRAELFTVTVGEEYGGMGMGDVEAAIVLEEIARVDVSSAILCQLVFNGPPRAIEHLGNDGLGPLAAARRGRRALLHRHHRTRRRLGRHPMRAHLTKTATAGGSRPTRTT
jgi:hypothetical protein